MRATKWAVAVASALLFVSNASAQYSPVTGRYHAPVSHAPLGYAPDAGGPGFYLVSADGQTIGPNYWVRPGFAPFQGPLPCASSGGNGQFVGGPPMAEPEYRYHPWARSPRDFFMFRENLEEQMRFQTRPSLLP